MKFTKLALSSALIAASLTSVAGMQMESFSNKKMQNGYSVELIDQCGVAPEKSVKDFVLFDQTVNRLTGWSHASNIEGLKLSSDNYSAKVVADSTCNNAATYQNVLVKKYANWDAQHVNGIEPQFSADDIKLEQLESIVLELKVSKNKSSIPSKKQISDLYQSYLNADQLAQLDDNKINFGITIFEAGFNDQSTASFNANIYLELDQADYFDQWVRITIPASSLNYFTEQNWGQTSIDPVEFAQTQVLGLRINPETQTGKVVRASISDTFEANTPTETFKEMNVSFKKVAFILK
ncbi:hypothetical protein [Marinicellulosiphila megalodicopiae]|uniref:hypothetical protein n=1 Tax=Marinicellulosiphila megalodicopiae TaxID=2724896 RepID=UPI003BAEF46D